MTELIGREKVLSELLAGRPGNAPLAEIRGGLGSGRTSILRQVRDRHRGTVHIFDLDRYDPGHASAGDAVTVGAAQASYARWGDLLRDVAGACLGPQAADEVGTAQRSARGRHLYADHEGELAASMEELREPFAPEAHVGAVHQAAHDVSDAFSACWRRATSTQPVPPVLLLDNVDRILDQPIGAWLVDLLDGLAAGALSDAPRPLVVMTRALDEPAATDVAPVGDDSKVDVHVLQDLTEHEVRQFVRAFCRGWVPGGATTQRLHELTSGRPATLRLVCELLWGAHAPSPDEVDALITTLPDSGSQQAALLVAAVLERTGEPDLLRAVELAAVPRSVNVSLLRALLKEDGESADADAMFQRLAALSFVERLDDDVVRVQEFVRRSILTRMRATDTARLGRLHARGAEHFRQLLHASHVGPDGETHKYSDQFLYEVPAWRAEMRQWLYHSGNLTTPGAQSAFLAEAATLFLDAFLWWGSYVHFELCDDLAADLGEISRQRGRPAPGRVVDALQQHDWPELESMRKAFVDVLDYYPPRSVKSEGTDWQRVRQALLNIQQLAGSAERATHLHAVIEYFLAHTWRHGPHPDRARAVQRADQSYRLAEQLFGTVRDDAWAVAWTCYERAEMFAVALTQDVGPLAVPAERGTTEPVTRELVQRLWVRAAEIVQPVAPPAQPPQGVVDDQADRELICNLHRLRADLLRSDGDALGAADAYRRAVLHAFLFHDVGGPPDEYTMQFYVDVRARALRHLVDLWRDDRRDEAVSAAGRIGFHIEEPGVPLQVSHEQLATDLAAAATGRPDALALRLWPAGPTIEDVGDRDGACAIAVRALRNALSYDPTYQQDLHAA